jgi:hypothetical protein
VCVVEGARWNDFAMHNITCSDVAYLHFIEEGEDVFYVATYNENWEEFHNYEPQSAQFWRCLVPVTDTSLFEQSLPEDFLGYLHGPTATESVMVGCRFINSRKNINMRIREDTAKLHS